ncbi:MAG TPA: HK97 gp10 family phage protein [Clostridiales bacterium]|nr:HK97 gp10 family phage protein [Clostridiales bacterium]
MARKTNTDFSTTSWAFLGKFIQDVQKEVGDTLNEGLEEATEYLADKLQAETPVNTGVTKDSWIKQMKYRNVKYINNTATNKQGYPIINILEYSKTKGKPFVRKVVEREKKNIERIIISKMEKNDG